MQWNLLLLILMGHCSSTTFQTHLFVNKSMNWSAAQMHCREHNTDLAIIRNKTERERLTVNKIGAGAWIGLRRQWRWSQSRIELKESEAKWETNEPNNVNGDEDCVHMNSEGEWNNIGCKRQKQHFVCYDENTRTHHLIEEEKTWEEAQRYCKKNYTGLISGPNQTSNETILADIKKKENQTWVSDKGYYVAIGLIADSWKWSGGTESSFNCHSRSSGDCVMIKSAGKWSLSNCTDKNPFFCHNNLILIHQNKTWEEALDYCREKHDDLVSIHTEQIQEWIQETVKEADSPYVWLGLRYTCVLEFWFWVTDKPFCYNKWTNATGDCEMSGAMEKGGNHSWFSLPDTERFNFICSKKTS